jgi:AraC family transcriptional regulator, transcriptional activator of pobA
MGDKIYSLDLKLDNAPASFVIKKMEDIGSQVDNPHRHNYYTVIWPYTATGKHYIDFKEYTILPDHIFFVSPEQVHQVITDPDPTGVVILFTPEFLQKNSIKEDFISTLKLFKDSDETPPLPITEAMKVNLKIFTNAILDAFNSESEMKYETIGAYLKLFLIECDGHCSLYPETNTQTIEVGRSIVKRFKELVEKHYNNWHQVKDYADALNVSPGYLNDVIKNSISKSAKEYIQNRLILEAKRLSLYTTKSIKEIGYHLGFDDPSHFSKFFKTNTGVSFQDFIELQKTM